MNLPNPLGEPTTSTTMNSSPAGDQFAIVDVVTATVPVRVINWPPHFLAAPVSPPKSSTSPAGTVKPAANTPPITPVRLINTNAIDVRVMNFPGVPPPLPGLRPTATPPPLPGRPEPRGLQSIFDSMPKKMADVFGRSGQAGRWVESFASKFTGGGATGSAIAGSAGLAVAGVGMVLDKVKSVFIDPLVSAAQGGFQAGVSHGSGIEVLGKSAMVLGVSLGVFMLPAVLRVSAALVGLSTQVEEIKRNFTQLSRVLAPFATHGVEGGAGDLFNLFMPFASRAAGIKKSDGILGAGSKAVTAGGPLGSMFKAFTGKDLLGDPQKLKKAEQNAFADVVASLRQSMGPPAGYHGIADVRQAAQLAALEDPLERRMRDLMVKELEKMQGGDWLTWISQIAQNTKPSDGK